MTNEEIEATTNDMFANWQKNGACAVWHEDEQGLPMLEMVKEREE